LAEPKSLDLLECHMNRILAILLLVSGAAAADGTLTPNIRISSATLGYDLQYRVYVPEGVETESDLPVLYITDGSDYIRHGKMPRVLNRVIGDNDIKPIVAVFVDARDPDHLKRNRRNSQFLCNPDYVKFYVEELIPVVEKIYPVGRSRDHRGILGLSFGATNAACFGLLGYETFADIGMHSPANHPVKALLPTYEKMPLLPLRMFLSTGRQPDDNTQANRKFRTVLKEKGYRMKYIETNRGHDWDNWRPLIDDVLLYFYASAPDATE